MNARPTQHGAPPDVDEGNPRAVAAWLGSELRSSPGRLGYSLRVVVVLLIVVTIAEVFRIPDIAVSAYLVLFLIVHLVMVVLSGPINNMRSMITGRYRIKEAQR